MKNRNTGEITMNDHSSLKDRTKGKFHQVNGKIKENVGRLVGNQELEAEGRKENLSGKVQDKIGQVEKVIGM
jgi:uncharacterized protein YjbJ (UPF0337 family)